MGTQRCRRAASIPTSGAGTAPSSRSACSIGHRSGRPRSCSVCSVVSGVTAGCRTSCSIRPYRRRRTFPGLVSGGRARCQDHRRSPPPALFSHPCMLLLRWQCWTICPTQSDSPRVSIQPLKAQNGLRHPATHRSPNRAGIHPASMGIGSRQLPVLGRPAGSGAGRPVAVRAVYPARS